MVGLCTCFKAAKTNLDFTLCKMVQDCFVWNSYWVLSSPDHLQEAYDWYRTLQKPMTQNSIQCFPFFAFGFSLVINSKWVDFVPKKNMENVHPMYAASLQALQASTTTNPTTSSQKKRSGDRRSINGDSQTQTTLVRRRQKKSRTSTVVGDSSTSIGASQTTATTTVETPPVHWVQGDGGIVKDPSHATVVAFVSMHLFREVKFIPDPKIMLNYNTTDSTSICLNVLTGCKCSVANVDREVWWNTKASNWVEKHIIHLRNSKVEALKNAFWSKFFCSFYEISDWF